MRFNRRARVRSGGDAAGAPELEHHVARALREAPVEDRVRLVEAADRLQVLEAGQQVVGVRNRCGDHFACALDRPQHVAELDAAVAGRHLEQVHRRGTVDHHRVISGEPAQAPREDGLPQRLPGQPRRNAACG